MRSIRANIIKISSCRYNLNIFVSVVYKADKKAVNMPEGQAGKKEVPSLAEKPAKKATIKAPAAKPASTGTVKAAAAAGEKVPAAKAESGQAQAALPQTGESKDKATLLSLGLASILGGIGILGASKRKKKEN